MQKPTVGLCLFLNGTPYELLHLIAKTKAAQMWQAKPLFVEDQTPRAITIHENDTCSLLHTSKRP